MTILAFTLDPGEQAEVIMSLQAPPEAETGTTSDWLVTLRAGEALAGLNLLGGQVTDVPKVIFFSILIFPNFSREPVFIFVTISIGIIDHHGSRPYTINVGKHRVGRADRS